MIISSEHIMASKFFSYICIIIFICEIVILD